MVGKSTVPVGTAERLAERIRDAVPEATLLWNPEFLREGHAVDDTLRPDRFVYGVAGRRPRASGRSPSSTRSTPTALAAGTPKIVTDLATAQLVKVAANSFLATKISFINAMAELCEVSGADVTQLADAIGLDDADRPAASSTPGSASAAAACPRTSGRSWPGPASSAPTRR